MKRSEFLRIVRQAHREVPERLREASGEVQIVVADWPTRDQLLGVGLDPKRDTLFGLYEGVPLPNREHNFGMHLPDQVTIFQGPLEEAFTDPEELRREIRVTLVHELGHFFGMDDEEIEDLGY